MTTTGVADMKKLTKEEREEQGIIKDPTENVVSMTGPYPYSKEDIGSDPSLLISKIKSVSLLNGRKKLIIYKNN